MVIIKILEGVLQAGSSSITFTDSDIPYSVISSYCSKDGLYPIREEVSGSTITLYYQPQSTNTNVALKLVKGNLEIIDALTDTSTNKALSANQGKLLNDALQEVFTSVSNGKALIAGAITDKGVDTPADATFAEMAYNIEQISGGSSDAAIYNVLNNGSSGTSTLTANADGYYLILLSYAYGGGGSITLPSGKSSLLSGSLLSGSRGVTWHLIQLERGDNVSIYGYPGGWQAFSKAIYYFENIAFSSNSSISNSVQVNDGTAQLITPSENAKYLVFGLGMGRSGNCRNDTIEAGSVIDASSKDNLGVYTVCGVYYGSGNTLPVFKFYGYDGGCGCIVSIKI